MSTVVFVAFLGKEAKNEDTPFGFGGPPIR